MAKISILIALLLQLCMKIQGLSSCSEYYTYTTKPGTDEILGQIEIRSPSPKLPPYNLKVGFNTNPAVHREPVARLEMAQPLENSIQDVEQGKPLIYHIHFPLGQAIPKLTKIQFNNQQICPNSQETEVITTTKEIELVTNQVPSLTAKIDEFSLDLATGDMQIKDESECGVSSYADRRNLLINNGEETRPGQWPWLVALFVVRKDHEFKCAGSLLTKKHVITAAHCLKLSFYSNDTVHPNVLVVTLGRFNLRQWREWGTMNREIASFEIHPDYAHADTGDSDLAILTLRTPVEYSPFIRPICLWHSSSDLQNVVNRVGYVVGWGQDELGNAHTAEPRMARVPIVSQENCLWSHTIFVSLTSNRTLCAGLRDQSGPCNGDSGSGLVLYDTLASRYRLRGIVSRSVAGNDYLCDLKKYIVYVDVAKYVPWIQQQISIT